MEGADLAIAVAQQKDRDACDLDRTGITAAGDVVAKAG